MSLSRVRELVRDKQELKYWQRPTLPTLKHSQPANLPIPSSSSLSQPHSAYLLPSLMAYLSQWYSRIWRSSSSVAVHYNSEQKMAMNITFLLLEIVNTISLLFIKASVIN